MAIKRAPQRGVRTRRTFERSVGGRKACVWEAKNLLVD